MAPPAARQHRLWPVPQPRCCNQPLLQENDRGDDKIRQLIDTLDMRKDEAIERTFKGVAKQFRDIFAQVGAGGCNWTAWLWLSCM